MKLVNVKFYQNLFIGSGIVSLVQIDVRNLLAVLQGCEHAKRGGRALGRENSLLISPLINGQPTMISGSEELSRNALDIFKICHGILAMHPYLKL